MLGDDFTRNNVVMRSFFRTAKDDEDVKMIL